MKRLFLALLAALFALPALAQQSWQLSGFIYRSAIPIVLPSSGSFSTNGTVTLTTALPLTYVSAYLYFPAGAICSGSTAGLYYTVMSSTTAGTVYNNTYSSGLPTIPGSPTTYSCATAPGAYTQTTGSAITLSTYQLAGGFLSTNGYLQVNQTFDYNSSSNTKTIVTALGGTTLQSLTPTTTGSNTTRITIENRGNASVQAIDIGGYGTAAGSAVTLGAIATGSNQNFTVSGQLAAATDYIVLESMQIAAMP
jgi:hypothetical protein